MDVGGERENRVEVVEYLDTFDVKNRIQDALNQLVTVKPEDPYAFLSDTLTQYHLPPKPQIVFVLGGPGAGKGTQCARIVEEFGYVHLSAGDLLRAERNSGSENGDMISNFIKEGKIVPVEITVALLKGAIESGMANGMTHFLVDGFPRNENNLEGWNTIMSDYCEVLFVLFLDCPEAVMRERLLERGKTSGRSDDNLESIKKRFNTYEKETMPIVAHFQEQNKVRHVVTDKSAGEVWLEVQNIFRERRPEVVFVLGGPGAGKGTQCARIVEEFGYVHLSAGDLLRAERATESANAELINNYIAEGKIVPVEITIALIKKAMEENCAAGKTQFLIDGFPRNRNNQQGWNKIMGDWVKLNFVLFFDCPESVMEARLLERGKTSGRSDDNIESIKKRFRTFVNSSKPVIDSYKEFGKVRTISSIPSPDEVYAKVRALFLPPPPQVVFVLGGPGAGKGTQCAHIVNDYGFVHLSAGDLLRAERNSGSENGEMISAFIKEGKIVPVEVTLALIKAAMVQHMGFGRDKFLIDGFPRNADNDDGWHAAMDDFAELRFVLVFDCPEDVMEARLLERGKTSGRSDDNLESIKKRFKTFVDSSMPIINKYEAIGMVRRMDATQSVAEVRMKVQTLFSHEFN